MKLLFQSVIILLAGVGVLSHGDGRPMHPREIASRQLAANKRHVSARKCASQITSFERERKLARRGLLGKRGTTTTTSALEPQETTIKNTTCVTAPEVTEGPFYLNNDLVRQDVRDNQTGILLELDIGVIDTSTCQPLPNVLVEIWHANATGYYSGYTTSDLIYGLENGTVHPPASGVVLGNKTDDLTFLRGGWETNSNGVVNFNTIYPGFYETRTIHIHTMVHQNITYNSNGTYSSRSGSLLHVGQMFFTDELSNEVVALSPYNKNTMKRTYNAQDSILAQENSNGYSAYVDTSLIGSDISDGIVGFITVGVNSAAEYEVESYNYYTGGDPFEAVTPSSTNMVVVRSSTKASSLGSTTESGLNSTTAVSVSSSSSAATSKLAALRWIRLMTRAFGI